MDFNKASCRELGTTVEAIVREALEERGLTVAYAGGSFGALEFTLKLRLAPATGETQEERHYKEYSRILGEDELPIGMLGATFTVLGNQITVTGFSPKRTTRDLMFKDHNGRSKVVDHLQILPFYKASLSP